MTLNNQEREGGRKIIFKVNKISYIILAALIPIGIMHKRKGDVIYFVLAGITAHAGFLIVIMAGTLLAFALKSVLLAGEKKVKLHNVWYFMKYLKDTCLMRISKMDSQLKTSINGDIVWIFSAIGAILGNVTSAGIGYNGVYIGLIFIMASYGRLAKNSHE